MCKTCPINMCFTFRPSCLFSFSILKIISSLPPSPHNNINMSLCGFLLAKWLILLLNVLDEAARYGCPRVPVHTPAADIVRGALDRRPVAGRRTNGVEWAAIWRAVDLEFLLPCLAWLWCGWSLILVWGCGSMWRQAELRLINYHEAF